MGQVLVKATGLVDGVEDGSDHGGGENEPDDGDALEEPVESVSHGDPRRMMSGEVSAGEGKTSVACGTGEKKGKDDQSASGKRGDRF